MVLQTTEALIGLTPTIVTAQLVSDLVSGKRRKRKSNRKVKRRRR